MGALLGGSQTASPPPPPPIPPTAIPPTLANPDATKAGANELAKARGAAGGTVKTSAQGDLVKPMTATPGLTTG
jgi:hypothetical protein